MCPSEYCDTVLLIFDSKPCGTVLTLERELERKKGWPPEYSAVCGNKNGGPYDILKSCILMSTVVAVIFNSGPCGGKRFTFVVLTKRMGLKIR